ncbi:polysaccharide biosynthesis/export family protein [Ectothiorhodospiraceae bacterium 2226]|nr:polysaccharide biosynthesis/export family protein [Ectothiorhodospiraceae bacterium 2226]
MKSLLRWSIPLLSFAAVGCAHVGQPDGNNAGGDENITTAAIESEAGVPHGRYQIGPEDKLEISVWREEGLQRVVLVKPDGWITFPLAGNLQAQGKTASELEEEITQRLRRYIPEPVVTVTVQEVASNKIFVIGKVNEPGQYVVGRYVDVMQALSLAGGLTPFAAENRIKILRREGAENRVLPFQYGRVRDGQALEQNIILRSGDVVVVP